MGKSSFSLFGSGASSALFKTGDTKSKINVTPFVDVMLVLLVIFITAAPVIKNNINVDLPESSAAPATSEKKPLSVSLDKDGKIFLDDKELSKDELFHALSSMEDAKSERIHLFADKSLSYAQVVDAMNAIVAAGFTKVALVTDGEKK
ncbi:ExbD/TolR family protein [Candidatus Hydrogenosomobacter endosymbioticus]|uniref:Protein TolR n=1 Tax=Candidatus Hydrogenosomobacter endosymbioticus TaxID=2558174 RepID=A0ABM7V894_9PROT|nr:biopolymer transporter ExbD [Candidatus Hydrogenosomobacter endosymbioticus]BDB95990.1 protein TolR [Candidatus Hydrogenosomobacter endosymbioticus]